MNFVIYIPCSCFSAIIGRNPYVDKNHAIIENLCKYNKPIYETLLEKYHEDIDIYKPNIETLNEKFSNEIQKINNNLSDTQKYEELQKIPEIKKYIETLDSQPIEYTEQEKARHLLEKLSVSEKNETKLQEFKVANKDNEILIKQYTTQTKSNDIKILQKIYETEPVIQKQIVMMRGTVQETNAIKKLEHIFEKINLKIDTSHIIRNINLYDVPVKLGGRVDCFLYEKNKKIGVIEVKTRKSAFFGIQKIKELQYELDQLSCYWFITKLKVFYICEFYNNEVKLHKFSDEDMIIHWEKLQSNLQQTCKKYLEIITFKNMKQTFVDMSNYLNSKM